MLWASRHDENVCHPSHPFGLYVSLYHVLDTLHETVGFGIFPAGLNYF